MDDVLRVASCQDRAPVLEAMVIAEVYHRLAEDVADRVGRSDANWFAFAVWSSKSIAESLDLSPRSAFLAGLASKLGLPRGCAGPFRALMLRLLGPSYQLGLGLANRTIFLETGSLAAGLGSQVNGGYKVEVPAPEPEPEPGEPVEVRPAFITDLLSPADDAYLDIAATLIGKAEHATDPARRSELILGASIALSAFEQARAQKALELVLYRPCRWLMRASWRSALAFVTRRPFRRLGLYTAPHEQMLWPVRQTEALWAHLYTRFMMTLQTPVSEIRLSKRLQPPPGSAEPNEFAPIQDADVRKLVETFVLDPAKARDGVSNWLDYRERMRFIVTYFRLYQSVPEMFRQPFDESVTEELEEEISHGPVPVPVSTEWFQKKVARHEERARRRGVRGWLVRKLYRSPLRYDPDAAVLARTTLERHLTKRHAGE